jgi:hypothetical protein
VEVHTQGGHEYVTDEGNVEPDSEAESNNLGVTEAWRSFIHTSAIPCHIYSRSFVFDAYLASAMFEELEEMGHPIARSQWSRDVAYVRGSCESGSEEWFKAPKDKKWFVPITGPIGVGWRAGKEMLCPGREEVRDMYPRSSHLTTIVAQAALGVAGLDVVAAPKVFQKLCRSTLFLLQLNEESVLMLCIIVIVSHQFSLYEL